MTDRMVPMFAEAREMDGKLVLEVLDVDDALAQLFPEGGALRLLRMAAAYEDGNLILVVPTRPKARKPYHKPELREIDR